GSVGGDPEARHEDRGAGTPRARLLELPEGLPVDAGAHQGVSRPAQHAFTCSCCWSPPGPMVGAGDRSATKGTVIKRPLLKEQQTRKSSLIGGRPRSVDDPGSVKTPKGRSRRGILFYRRRSLQTGLPSHTRTWRPKKNGVLRVLPAPVFDTAKTHFGPLDGN